MTAKTKQQPGMPLGPGRGRQSAQLLPCCQGVRTLMGRGRHLQGICLGKTCLCRGSAASFGSAALKLSDITASSYFSLQRASRNDKTQSAEWPCMATSISREDGCRRSSRVSPQQRRPVPVSGGNPSHLLPWASCCTGRPAQHSFGSGASKCKSPGGRLVCLRGGKEATVGKYCE